MDTRIVRIRVLPLVITAIVAGCTPAAGPSSSPSPSNVETPSASPAPTSASPPTSSPTEAQTGWQSAGKMDFPRLGWRSALLTGGQVLVVGNQACVAAGEPTGSERAEIYDPTAGAWAQVDSLNKERADPALVALQDGRGMVLGGTNPESQPYSSTKVFSPGDASWSDGPLMDRAGATQAVTLADGSVLAVGRARAETLEKASEVWRRSTPLPATLDPERLLLLSNGEVVAFAGLVDPTVGDTALMRFVAADDEWESIEAPSVLRPIPIAIADGSMLAFGDDEGGAHVQRYDPDSATWFDPAQMAIGRVRAQITVLPDGRVLVAGGVPLTSEAVDGGYSVTEGPALRSTEIYDPAVDAWSAGPELLEARQGGHAIALTDGSVLVFGGYTETPEEKPSPDTGTPGRCPDPLATSERLQSVP